MYVISSAVNHCHSEADLAAACQTDIASHKTATSMVWPEETDNIHPTKQNKQTNKMTSFPQETVLFVQFMDFH